MLQQGSRPQIGHFRGPSLIESIELIYISGFILDLLRSQVDETCSEWMFDDSYIGATHKSAQQ